MLASLFSSPTLSVTVSEDIVFLHPIDADYPTQDPVLRGTVLLTLPSRKAVKQIKVVFEGLCDVWGGDGHPYETTVVLRKDLDHDLHGEVLEAGKHAFNFSFIVPSSADASQRSIYGRTRYYVKATAEFDQVLAATVTSPPVAVWLSPTPTAPGEIPQPMDWSIQHYSPELGPLGVGFASPYLTVGALASMRLSLLGPPQPLTIVSVNAILHQQFEIIYQNGTVARPKLKKHVLVKVDKRASPSLAIPIHNPETCQQNPNALPIVLPLPAAVTASTCAANGLEPPPGPGAYRPVSTCCKIEPDVPIPDPTPLSRVEVGQEFHHARICRIPDDNAVRATTLPGSNAKIVVSHQLHIEVRYRKDGDDEDMVLTIGKPLTITGCCAMLDNLCLPAYRQSAPVTTVEKPLESHCMCNMSTKMLLDRDGEQLQRAGAIDSPGASTRNMGVGVDKSPAINDTLALPAYLARPSSENVLIQDSGYPSPASSCYDESCAS
ncbi:hypothetical protein JCM10908_006884 [Rhodotorula pacifica]|uniref:uncharacterized protein n=1 Tax=Rhodotorula pacifica TaxID=1495444 RepID=UPI003170564F